MMGNASGHPSPKQAATITVTFKSIMDTGNPLTVVIQKNGTVRDLKIAYANRSGQAGSDRQAFVFDGKELTDDDAPLEKYGIVSDCVVQLSMKLESGIREKAPPSDPNVIVILPEHLPTNLNSVTNAEGLREALRGLTALPSAAQPAEPPPADTASNQWTPEKEMEHAMTRNRMRELLRRRRRHKTPGSPNHSSNCGSAVRSPLHSAPATPPNERLSKAEESSIGAQTLVEPDAPFTLKELQKFLDPPETPSEMERLRRDVHDPPEDLLLKVKAETKSPTKTHCNSCHRRLSFSQQTMLCHCGGAFCTRHKNPEDHQCSADYKKPKDVKEPKDAKDTKEQKSEAENVESGTPKKEQ